MSDSKETNPQLVGWQERVPLDYQALTATRENVDKFSGLQDQSWASNAAKYEWSDEYGDVGPPIPELEQQLFSNEHKLTVGHYLETLTSFEVDIEGPNKPSPVRFFEDAGLHPITLENVTKCNYVLTTPIQAYTIPAILMGHDVIGVAHTGSGKTAAYLVPILSKLMGKAKKLAAPRPNPVTFNPATDAMRAEPLVLVIVPTRELALQIFDEARRLCYRTMLRPCVVYGGGPRNIQLKDLMKGCDLLVGTAGRLMDFVTTEGKWLSLRRLKYTVIDEADEMVQSDWEEELAPILSGGAAQSDGDHTYLMFSATFSKEARALARRYLADDHIRIRVGRIGSAHENVLQNIVWTDEDAKLRALEDLLMSTPPSRTIVFCNTTRTVDSVDDFLYNKNFPVTSIHSARSQREREDSLKAFRDGRCPLMVASAVSARGLDIKNIMHIINFDIPSAMHGGIDEYVHRIGRTGRMGNRGQATSFYNERNEDVAEGLVKILLECKQDVPDFLQRFAPVDGKISWDDDTDEETEGGQEAEKDTTSAPADAGDGWGAGSDSAPLNASADAWDGKVEQAAGGW